MRAALLILPLFVLAAGAQVKPTAVYTIDSHERSFPPGTPLEKAVSEWAAGCSIEPGGAIYVLECEPGLPRDRSPEDIQAKLALFRDLFETVYLVGCPDAEALRREDERSPEDKRDEPDPQLVAALRDCEDITTGQTFSAEVEDDVVRIVLRGRQVDLTLYRTYREPRTTRTPYTPDESRGALKTVRPMADEPPDRNLPQAEPDWTPPQEPPAAAEARNPQPALRDPQVAKTDLPTGRLNLTCRDAEVYLGGAWMGFCPLTLPLEAGKHEIRLIGAERAESCEVEIVAGGTLELASCADVR